MRLMSSQDFAIFMRDTRIARGMSQADLADKVDKSRKWVINVELGITQPTLPAVIQVSRALGFSVDLEENDSQGVDLIALALGEG